MKMVSINLLRYLYKAFEKPCLNNSLANSISKFAHFHESKLLSDYLKIEIKMPSLSPTMTEGTIVKWLKKEGDSIEPGDVLCEIQTDKAVVGFEVEEEGVLQKIVVPENTQNIQLGQIIAVISGEGQSTVTSSETLEGSLKIVEKQEISKNATSTELLAPSVKRLLNEFNIKQSDLSGSGPRNNLLKGDVLKFIKYHNLKPVKVDVAHKPKIIKDTSKPMSKGTYVDIPVSSTEKEKAGQFIQSKLTIPHGYMTIDCRVGNTLNHIVNNLKKDEDISLNEFIIKSTITALKRVPKLNTVRRDGQLFSPDSINILFTHFNNGQYETSLFKDDGNLTMQLFPEQMECNSLPLETVFKISSLSSLCISNFVDVISPNDVATLTVSGIQFVFEEDMLVKKIRVTLSYDNYVVGETEAGEFLETFKRCLESPLTLLI